MWDKTSLLWHNDIKWQNDEIRSHNYKSKYDKSWYYDRTMTKSENNEIKLIIIIKNDLKWCHKSLWDKNLILWLKSHNYDKNVTVIAF